MTATTYWAVAGHYTIGDEYPSRGEAFAAAAVKLDRLLAENENDGRFNHLRIAVDERVKDSSGDHIAKRTFIVAEPREERS